MSASLQTVDYDTGREVHGHTARDHESAAICAAEPRALGTPLTPALGGQAVSGAPVTSMVLPSSKHAPRNCTMLASLRSSRINTSLRARAWARQWASGCRVGYAQLVLLQTSRGQVPIRQRSQQHGQNKDTAARSAAARCCAATCAEGVAPSRGGDTGPYPEEGAFTFAHHCQQNPSVSERPGRGGRRWRTGGRPPAASRSC